MPSPLVSQVEVVDVIHVIHTSLPKQLDRGWLVCNKNVRLIFRFRLCRHTQHSVLAVSFLQGQNYNKPLNRPM